MDQFRVTYEYDGKVSHVDAECPEDSKEVVLDIMRDWIDECEARGGDPQEDLFYCFAWIEQLDEGTCDWDEFWSPSEEELRMIGWLSTGVHYLRRIKNGIY